VIDLERKTKILMISAVLVLAILSGIAALAYANNVNNDTNTSTAVAYNDNGYFMGGHGHGRGGWQGCGIGPETPITVSQGFKDTVINITRNNTDVQNLLNEGYNITAVRPIINATVEADGTITLKATSAVLTLTQSTTSGNTTSAGRAFVWVNIEQAKVTRIVILTKTVIENP
jgi:Tfp pilus assembly protein PilE